MLKSRGFQPQRPPARDRTDEFKSFVLPRPVARMAGAADMARLAPALLAPIDHYKPAATDAAGARHMGKVAALGCVLCRRLGLGTTAAEVHHVREGQGGAQRASDFLSVPLCPEHHRGNSGLHGLGTRAFERRYGIDELGLLAETIAEITA